MRDLRDLAGQTLEWARESGWIHPEFVLRHGDLVVGSLRLEKGWRSPVTLTIGGRSLMSIRAFGVLAAGLLITASGLASQAPDRVLLVDAMIVDGTGAAAYAGELLIEGVRIAAVGRTGELTRGDARIEELGGQVLAPGFIDIHNHSTQRLARDPAATTQVAQGVTTVVVGADGGSPWPIAEYLDRIAALPPALNVATLVGHGTVRRRVMGDDYRREATPAEVDAMAGLVAAGMADGAFGLSSGLEYDPGFYSSTEELISLARVAAEHGGFYMSHMRDEEEGLLDAVAEAIRIGEAGGLPVQISHIKAGNASVCGKADEVLAMMQAARRRGLDITADQYPYTAWQSNLGIVVRSRQFQNPDEVAAGLAAAGGGERLQIVGYEANPSLNGLRLNQIAEGAGRSEVEMYMELMAGGGSGVIGHTMNEQDVVIFMSHPLVMTASDGGIGSAHPRGAGAFAQVLGHYTRELGLLTLERAVQRGTSMPARRLGLTDRGVIQAGAFADLVAFDPETVAALSTFTQPLLTAVGVRTTWVSGQAVWHDGAVAGERPGRILRR